MRRYLRLLCSVPSGAKEPGGFDSGLSARARSGTQRARPTLSGRPVFGLLPTPGTPHAREKRLHRFLRNPRLDPRSVTDGLARLIFGSRGRGLWPILFDQTKAGATQALFAGVPFQAGPYLWPFTPSNIRGRKRPRAARISWKKCFLADIETALPARVRPVFIGIVAMRGQRCSGSRIVKVAYTLFVDARARASNTRAGAVSWPSCLVRIAAPFVIPECFIKRESVFPVDVVVYHDRNSRNLGGYWFPVRAAHCCRFAR